MTTPTRSMPSRLTHDEVKALVGGKAANLAVMSRELGLRCHRASSSPPPPAAPTWLAVGQPASTTSSAGWPIEAVVGRRFCDPADPLLVSVRSGAPVSMPGMMDTILNLGLNDATAAALPGPGSKAFAARCRERLDASFRSIVGANIPNNH